MKNDYSKYTLKNVNVLTDDELVALERFSIFTTPTLTESGHVSSVTNKVIDGIYDYYLKKIETYCKTGNAPEPGYAHYSGWNFNEYAADSDEMFYQTEEEDPNHHPIMAGFFDDPFSTANGRFYGRTPGTVQGPPFRVWYENDRLVIAINYTFAFPKNRKFNAYTWLHDQLAHELTHLYRSAVAVDNNINASKRNDLLSKYDADKMAMKPLFRQLGAAFVLKMDSELYLFDPNEMTARLKQTEDYFKTVVTKPDEVEQLRREALDRIREMMDVTHPLPPQPDKTALIGALVCTSRVNRLSGLDTMRRIVKHMETHAFDASWQDLVEQYMFGYYFFRCGTLYLKDLKRQGITTAVVRSFFSEDNYRTLLNSRSVAELQQNRHLPAILQAAVRTARLTLLQYQVVVYNIIDAHLPQIYRFDDSTDEDVRTHNLHESVFVCELGMTLTDIDYISKVRVEATAYLTD